MDGQKTDRDGGSVTSHWPSPARLIASAALVLAGAFLILLAGSCPDSALGGICMATISSIGGGMIGAGLFNPFKAAPVGAFTGFWLIVVLLISVFRG